MTKEIQCFDEERRPKCHYYSIVRYGKLCSFDGTWNPCKIDCPNFVPVGPISIPHVADLGWAGALDSVIKSCHNCIWRKYGGNIMTCDNVMVKVEIQTNPKFITPCEWFELDTGEDYLVRQKEGIDFLRREQ